VEISKFSEYVRPMIDHLTTLKFCHIDPVIRELSSTAVRNLTIRDYEYVFDVVLDKLIRFAGGSNVEAAAGAIMCLSAIIEANTFIGELSQTRKDEICNISITVMKSLQKFSLPDNILLRESLNCCIVSCSTSK
jgi:hypothetical protein